MAVTQRYKNMDAYYRFTDGTKVILNDLSYIDSTDMDDIRNKLVTVYDEATITTVATCDCGHVTGKHHLGVQCDECGTSCVDPRDKREPILWMRKRDDKLPFINPAYWNSINRVLSIKMDTLRWLSDPTYNPPYTPPAYLHQVVTDVLEGVRSYYQVVNKLDVLLTYLINSSAIKAKATHPRLVMLRDIYRRHPNDVTSAYLPIPNKKMFVMENTTKGKYTNLVLGDAIDVITNWLKCSDTEDNLKRKSQVTVTAVSKLAKMYLKIYTDFIISKQGNFRKHVYGARANFTFRTVISAATGKHRHDQIIPPWVVLVTVFRPHVLNKLIKRGYSYKAADSLLTLSISKYSPVIDEIQRELIAECPHPKGIPVICNRNPSLLAGSILFMYIPYFNTDPDSLVTTFSPLSAKKNNADFDGNYDGQYC